MKKLTLLAATAHGGPMGIAQLQTEVRQRHGPAHGPRGASQTAGRKESLTKMLLAFGCCPFN